MSYLALARKWRPRTFSELVGQEHITKTLINALNQERLHHAYLFTGTRGVGKTSVARILAKALNCETGIKSEPCLTCDACLSIEQGRFIDLIEIDGASKTRVEDTRELLDNVPYAPAVGRFKIYLIDEVHMLSQHSFNALLKTLEEPPTHVKFILATTDPQKVPITVLSRCLHFNLRHVPEPLISQHLQTILKNEQLECEVEALNILAHAARGSMRDALSLLDQAITSCNDTLLASDVKAILGYTQHDYALKIIQALSQQNAGALLELSQKIGVEGGYFEYVLDEMLQYFHTLCVYQSIGDINPLISPSEEIKALASECSAEDIQLFYQLGIKARAEMHLAPTLAIGFTMCLLRMLLFRPAVIPAAPVSAFQVPAAAAIPETHPLETVPTAMPEDSAAPMLVEEKPPTPLKTTQEQSTSAGDCWADIIPKLQLTGIALTALEHAEFMHRQEREVVLRVSKGHVSLFTPSTIARIETALTGYYNSPAKLVLNTDDAVRASPAQQKEKAVQEKHKHAEQALHSDSVFLQVQQEFSAELVKNSIVPLKDGL